MVVQSTTNYCQEAILKEGKEEEKVDVCQIPQELN